ncbi:MULTISPECIES: hypothetical protein [Pasteurellaceae]|uniref:Uncharacterized protein n=1 Tax=Pasteurella atlantica TaxID=2827233 RepID=A0AAW8CG43_9PAST|nr:hypothetical protein [Pasteurella atlantica]MBR0573006.1 hypothetical protein [Pasteurella atlantica]MDP8038867.1 hypothetical protein [Pasteurella atlantica]MDP8041024.1 hypothetical protein [Pasteurella atlantica]MDP8043160.1 hypothetical protein [Pasteurella atlantica]MDP8045246.1 hypothetical protein [Pasteurella atlantica]
MKKLVFLLTSIITFLPMYAQASICDVIIHSSKSLKTTRDEVRKYNNFDNVRILKSGGWFLVSVANLNKQASEQILNEWKAQGKIPNDSYCSSVRYPLFENSPYNKKVTKSTKVEAIQGKKESEPRVEQKAVIHKNNEVKKENIVQKPMPQTETNVTKVEVKNEKIQQPVEKNVTKSNVDPQAKLMISEFNKKIANYQKNKLNFIDSYNKTNNALNLTLQSPTQDNLSQYERLLQALLEAEKVLIESYNNVVNDYKINMESFNKIKEVDKLPSFLKNERMNIEMISNKISEMNGRLCQNKIFKHNCYANL